MHNFINNIDAWKEKLPRTPYVSSCWRKFLGTPPLMALLPLKWRNEDPVAFARCINASAICFTDLLAHELVTKTLEVRHFWVSRKGKMKGIAEKWKETKDIYMNQEWRWTYFFPIWCNFVGRSVRMGRSGHLFLGKSGVNSTGLCLRENFSIIFCPKSIFIVFGVLFIWAVASLHSTVWGFHCLDATETSEAAQL